MAFRVLKEHALPIQLEGFPYILGSLILAVSSAAFWKTVDLGVGGRLFFGALAVAFAGLAVAFAWFYRCPRVRTPEDDVQAVLSPADGQVLHIRDVSGSPIRQKKAKKVSIFMSLQDAHVNRAPVSGVIETIKYTRGKFFSADLEKASDENEHNWVVMRSDLGPRVAFVQIAGLMARRIVCYVKPGERLARGERYGMIRFGSRMEIVVPANAEILVQPGEKTIAGQTKVARLKITA